MPSPRPRTVTIRHKARLFRRNRRGSAAIEFALVAPLFFALLFAIMEYALMFFAAQVLETATQDTARLILTGQAQTQNFDKAKFKEEFCKHIVALLDCAGGITIDVKSYSSFDSITPQDLALPVTNRQFVDPARYQPGGRNDIVMVRVYYQWQFYVTNLGFNVANLGGGKRLLTASFAFRNEPFPAAASSSSQSSGS